MKLVDMTCTGCGANVTVDPAVKVATCNICGKQMLISRSGEFGEGYDREMGRIQAQRDMEEEWKKEREEKLRLIEEEKKRKAEQQKMDHIRKQLNIVCLAESIICLLFMGSPLVINDGIATSWIRFGSGFVQLGLVSVVTFFFTKDEYYGKVILACIFCALLSVGTSFFSGSILCFVAFNAIKLTWMMRVEKVRYSWKDILHQMIGKEVRS
ncbi:MAG: hypothetical protein J6Y58_01685 [Clostridiales bacterium]|nr:hypothetical protein [Clostridiales bacterium]